MLATEECFHHVFRRMIIRFWYLSEELIALLLFDPETSLYQKRKIMNAMQADVVQNKPPIELNFDVVNDLKLHNFAPSNTAQFFTILVNDYSFLESDPELWQKSKIYNDALKDMKFLRVTNDNVESGVALIGEYNKLHIKDEDMKQYLLQEVLEQRKRFPSSSKSLLNS